MWISKKKFRELEKKVADLEKKIQNQPDDLIARIQKEFEKALNTPGKSAFGV